MSIACIIVVAFCLAALSLVSWLAVKTADELRLSRDKLAIDLRHARVDLAVSQAKHEAVLEEYQKLQDYFKGA